MRSKMPPRLRLLRTLLPLPPLRPLTLLLRPPHQPHNKRFVLIRNAAKVLRTFAAFLFLVILDYPSNTSIVRLSFVNTQIPDAMSKPSRTISLAASDE